MLQLFQTLEGYVATKKWSQNMLTKQRAIFWDHFGVGDLIIEKVRTIVSEPGVQVNKMSNAIKDVRAQKFPGTDFFKTLTAVRK